MKPSPSIDEARQQAILSSLAGFPFLFVFGIGWIAASALSYWVPPDVAPWIYITFGLPAAFIAMAIERRVGYVPVADPDPLLGLGLQILFIQVVAFPAILLVWDHEPAYVPAAFAAVVGGHFLPFQWVYKTRVFGVLGVLIALGPFVLVVLFGESAMHTTGFLVGAMMLLGSFLVRAHAKATWLEWRTAYPEPHSESP